MTNDEKLEIFDEIFNMNHEIHWELNNYKTKRKDKRELLQKRLNSPQTKSMLKKIKKSKINLENVK